MSSKLKKIIVGAAIGLGVATTAPVIPQDMTWYRSYENMKFETADGDLAMDEYAYSEGYYYIRTVPKDQGDTTITKQTQAVKGKKKVVISKTEHAYYSEFIDSSGKIVRVPYKREEYDALRNIKYAPQPEKTEMTSLLSPIIANAAIAYDNSTGALGTAGSSISVSFSHTITGNATLIVGSMLQDSTAADRETSTCKFNSDDMFYVGVQDANSFRIEVYELPNPDVGALTVYCEFNDGPTTPPADSFIGAVSFTGSNTGSPVVNVFTGGSGSSAAASTTITTTVDNSWVVDFMFSEEGTDDILVCCGVHLERLQGSGTGRIAQVGTAGPVVSAGATTTGWGWPGTEAWDMADVAVIPTCNSNTGCTEVFTTTGTTAWVAPPGVTSIKVACWGGGGGGGKSDQAGGSGGGGGAFASSTVSVSAGTSYNVVVGTGGAGQTASVGAGTNGGNSTFDTTTVVCAGGTGGGGATAADSTGGAGGTTAASTGDVESAGGAGGNGKNTNDTSGGGGGGGGPHGTGVAGGDGTTVGGNGGAGNNGTVGLGTGGPGGGGAAVAVAANGGAAGWYGGGGAGGGTNGGPLGADGGDVGGGGGGGENGGGSTGGNGMVTITYTTPTIPVIATDNVSNCSASDTTAVTSITWTHTVADSTNGLLFVGVTMTDGTDADRTVTGVTYNSDAMTLVREDDDDTNNISSSIWYRVSPDVGVSQNIVASFNGTVDQLGCGAISVTGVHQTNPIDAQAGGAIADDDTPTTAITTTEPNDWVFDTIVNGGGGSPDCTTTGTSPTQNEVWDIVQAAGRNCSAGSFSKRPATGAYNMGWNLPGVCNTCDSVHSVVAFRIHAAAVVSNFVPNVVIPGFGGSIILPGFGGTWIIP